MGAGASLVVGSGRKVMVVANSDDGAASLGGGAGSDVGCVFAASGVYVMVVPNTLEDAWPIDSGAAGCVEGVSVAADGTSTGDSSEGND